MAQVLAVPRSDDPDGPPLGRRRRLQSIFSRRSDRSHRVLRHGIRCFLLALKLVSIGVPRTGDPPDGAIGYQQPPFGSPTSSSQLLTFRNSKASDPPVAMGCTSGLFCGICLCTFAISSLVSRPILCLEYRYITEGISNEEIVRLWEPILAYESRSACKPKRALNRHNFTIQSTIMPVLVWPDSKVSWTL